MAATGEGANPWWIDHAGTLKVAFRMIFGVMWGIDGALKFGAGVVGAFPGMVADSAQGQPAWLSGWFAFWQAQVTADPALWVYGTGVLELALAFALLAGFMRKTAYAGGIILSLLIWAVPEGFGGPYGPGSTDIGTGIVYAIVFLMLLELNALCGPSRWSVDRWIEKRWPSWSRLAEIRSRAPSTPDRAV